MKVSDFSNTNPVRSFSFEIQSQLNKESMKLKITFLALFLISLSGISKAQTLTDLNWMAGYWTSAEDGSSMEELWTTASGGMLVGVHRDVFANGRSSFEYLRIVETAEGIVYLASPGGRPATPFTLTAHSANTASFENLENDFPQRIIYTKKGKTLTARIEDKSGEKGMEWTWTKTNFDK